MGFCPNCGHGVDLPLPVEPLFLVTTAAMLVPSTKNALLQWAHKHKDLLDPPYYRKWDRQRYRYFSARDIRVMREALVTRVRYPKQAAARAATALARALSEGRHA